MNITHYKNNYKKKFSFQFSILQSFCHQQSLENSYLFSWIMKYIFFQRFSAKILTKYFNSMLKIYIYRMSWIISSSSLSTYRVISLKEILINHIYRIECMSSTVKIFSSGIEIFLNFGVRMLGDVGYRTKLHSNLNVF